MDPEAAAVWPEAAPTCSCLRYAILLRSDTSYCYHCQYHWYYFTTLLVLTAIINYHYCDGCDKKAQPPQESGQDGLQPHPDPCTLNRNMLSHP